MGELLDMKMVAKRLGCSKAQVSKLINGKVKGTTLLPTVHL
jgi:DNA-binding LacI/PurR family transcriptional regulator